nr:immunoglobulin light chain junction region [Macaca mulatta]MOX78371.1 immunoglobulin light chain junction region [Macaca mulatta]MOY06950.1 immunoglobulin light chain junction region [Macaca mulatta]
DYFCLIWHNNAWVF